MAFVEWLYRWLTDSECSDDQSTVAILDGVILD